jgi:hypothetical protein
MDWTTPLRSQQADFIQRLKSDRLHLLHCETEGQHSELTVISGDRLEQLRDFCWEMADKHKRMPVKAVFINNLKGKLGEEVIKARLADFVTEVDYEKRPDGDGKVDFTLTSDSEIGIQVKARCGNIDTVQWSITSEEIDKNAVLICVLIQEVVNEAQTEYNLILAGFLPTELMKQNSIGIGELLYSGGLRSYLEFLQYKNLTFRAGEIKQETNQNIHVDTSPYISVGSWQYALPSEELIKLEKAIQELRKEQSNGNEINRIPANEGRSPELEQIWQQATNYVKLFSTQQLLRQQCCLLTFSNQTATIGVNSKGFLKLVQGKLLDIEAAFEAVCGSKIKIKLKVRGS